VSPGAAGGELFAANSHRAALAERERDLLREQVSTLTQHVSFLQAQVDRRAEEIKQERRAGEQLRVMLVRLEETNRELSGALVQRALPPAPVEPVKKTRCWELWR
jgi:hypothetical protein